MDALAGPFAVAAVLVAVGGVSKLMAPASTAAALRGVGVPAGDLAARGLGAIEVVVGASALAVGGRLSAIVLAFTYLGFAAFVEVALRGGQGSCGCFGRDDTPPTRLHTVVNLVAVGVASAAAVGGIDPIDATLSAQPWGGVPFGGFVLLGTTLTAAVLALLPAVLTAPRPLVAGFEMTTRGAP